MQRGEYEWATHTNERTAASYFPHNFVPIRDAGLYDFVDGEARDRSREFARCRRRGTRRTIRPAARVGGERAFYIADLAPTTAHLPLPWIMGYDVEPLVTLETKRRILARAVAEEWLVIFEHDVATAWAYLTQDARGYAARG